MAFAEITEDQMRSLLHGGRRPPDRWVFQGRELVASWFVPGSAVCVKVYTTIRKDGTAAPCGEDAIKICVVDENTRFGDGLGVGKMSPTIRTDGWEERMKVKIRSAYLLAKRYVVRR